MNMQKQISLFFSAVLLLCLSAHRVTAETPRPAKPALADNTSAGDKAWQELLKASRPPNPPAEWSDHTPSPTELAAFAKKRGELAGQVADQAKDFYTKYPTHPKAAEAKEKEQSFREM